MTTLSPRLEAHACRIWGIAREHDWKITQQAVADTLGIPKQTVSDVVIAKGWQPKFSARNECEVSMSKRTHAYTLRERRKGHNVDVNALDLVELMGGGE